MDNGAVVESGRHVELMERDGKYTEMFRMFNETVMKNKSTKSDSTTDGTNLQRGVNYLKIEDTQEETNEGTNDIHKPKAEGNIAFSKLVLVEETEIVNIGVRTFTAYIHASGGWLVGLDVVLLYFLSAFSLVFSDYWLSAWIRHLTDSYTTNSTVKDIHADKMQYPMNTTMSSVMMSSNSSAIHAYEITKEKAISSETYLVVYISSLAFILALILVNGFCHAKVAITASNEIHDKCLDTVMKAPMSFFDSNPTGRILNRFSKDLDEVDVFIPQAINQTLRYTRVNRNIRIRDSLVTDRRDTDHSSLLRHETSLYGFYSAN
ncbi:ATP-binding cassette sub-family C member 12-like [Dreissena polymorpha]|uniref:ABC transmembrane type-1 domain-containing protein n=1 Tax=Dreissena polymorpha TaxID=45954 RepID=A0A9D4N4C0_DREPO|nr:ATP-binding cassette sub-family C member 12-like [Dreissena polymorpha]KAH3887766.1 hypothetical protein DPMN_011785 [Dreissena polymorpha]